MSLLGEVVLHKENEVTSQPQVNIYIDSAQTLPMASQQLWARLPASFKRLHAASCLGSLGDRTLTLDKDFWSTLETRVWQAPPGGVEDVSSLHPTEAEPKASSLLLFQELLWDRLDRVP